MAALDQFPCILPVSFPRFGCRGVPDRCRVEDDIGALQCHAPGRFGEPLVITDEDGDPAEPGRYYFVSVARIEVALLKESRVLGNMHFVVLRTQLPVSIDHCRSVIVPAISSLFKDRDDDDHLMLPGTVSATAATSVPVWRGKYRE